MKILRLIASGNLEDGGPIEGIIQVGRALRGLGHQQDVATLDSPGAPFLQAGETHFIPLGEPLSRANRSKRRRFRFTRRAIPWLRNNLDAYDVVIVSGLWNFATLAARLVLPSGPIPYVVFTHGMLDPWFQEKYRVKGFVKKLIWPINEGLLLRSAEAVLFTSEEERLRARISFRPYRVKEQIVAYGTADVEGDIEAQAAAFMRCVPTLKQGRYFLFLGRLHEKKGCDLLVDGFADLVAQHPEFHLVMAGPDMDGIQNTLVQKATDRGVSDKIHWPGMLRGDAKWGAYRSCEAFVLPSHQENFGIALAEAMACGRPVLTTDKVNIWREIEADGAGIVRSDDSAGVRAMMSDFVLLSPKDRVAMGLRARASFLNRFHIERAAKDLAAILEDCIQSTKKQRRRSPDSD